jgi:integrase
MGKADRGEGTIETLELLTKDGKPYKRYAARVTVGFDEKGKQIQKRGPRREKRGQAVEDKRRLLHEVKVSKPVKGKLPLLKEYLADWLNVSSLKRYGTYKFRRTAANAHIIPALGHKRLNEVTYGDIQTLISTILKDAKDPTKRKAKDGRATARGVWATLSVAYRDAVATGLLPRDFLNPCTKVKKPLEHTKPLKVWTPAQIKRVLEVARDTHLYAIIYTAITTGLRYGELCGLRWQDLEEVIVTTPEGATRTLLKININHTLKEIPKRDAKVAPYSAVHLFESFYLGDPKTESSKATVLGDEKLREILLEHRQEQRGQAVELGLVFPDVDGSPLGNRKLLRLFAKIIERAGVPYVTFHDLRDTMVSYLHAQGVELIAISKKVRHKYPSTTADKYTHLLEGSQVKAVMSLEDMLKV